MVVDFGTRSVSFEAEGLHMFVLGNGWRFRVHRSWVSLGVEGLD